MNLAAFIKNANTAGRSSSDAGVNRVLISVVVLTVLVSLVVISIARRTSITTPRMPLQQVVGGRMEVSTKESRFFGKPQPSFALHEVAVRDLVFAGSNTVWTRNHEGELLLTRDAGKSWLNVGGEVSKEFDAFTMLDGYHGWAVESENKIWKTDDSGQSWYLASSLRQDPALHYSASQIIFSGRVNGWIVGTFKVWRTRDAGVSWHEVNEFSYSRFKNRVREMKFLESRLGWAICEDGLIIHTDDGGDHWRSIVSSLSFNLVTTINASSFIDQNRGWISVSDARQTPFLTT